MPDNLWKKSADPKQRAAAAKQHANRKSTAEMRTKNVMRQSLLDQMRGKPGKKQ